MCICVFLLEPLNGTFFCLFVFYSYVWHELASNVYDWGVKINFVWEYGNIIELIFVLRFFCLFFCQSSLDLIWRSCVCISIISTTNIEWWYYFKLCLRTVQYYVFASQSIALKLSGIHDPSCRDHVYMMDRTYTVHVWIVYDPYIWYMYGFWNLHVKKELLKTIIHKLIYFKTMLYVLCLGVKMERFYSVMHCK